MPIYTYHDLIIIDGLLLGGNGNEKSGEGTARYDGAPLVQKLGA